MNIPPLEATPFSKVPSQKIGEQSVNSLCQKVLDPDGSDLHTSGAP
jgi:hypothetical protein